MVGLPTLQGYCKELEKPGLRTYGKKAKVFTFKQNIKEPLPILNAGQITRNVNNIT